MPLVLQLLAFIMPSHGESTLILHMPCNNAHVVSRPCCAAGKSEAKKKTIVRPRADQLTSTYTSAQLAYRYGFPILQEKSNRRARA